MPNQNPEQIARDNIDKLLVACGWIVQSKNSVDLNAGLGVAVREYPTDVGPADYVLFVGGEPRGVIEAKPENQGVHLTQVEDQSAGYANSKLKYLENNPLSFVYESTGTLTRFTDYRDKKPRSRPVFAFHRPETLHELSKESDTLRDRLLELPELPTRNWYSVASSADGLKLIAADNAGVYTSTNGGVSWTQRRTASHLTRVASSADGTRLVAAEYLGNIYTSSTSGAIWIERYSTTGNSQWQSVASDSTGAKIAVVRNFGQILISFDFGVTWTEKSVGPSGTQTRWSSITMSADGMRIAAVGPTYAGPPSVPGTVEISYDGGNSWTLTGSGTSWLAVAMSGDGGRMAASMADPPQSKLYSGPVATTTIVDSITGPKDSAVELVYIGNNQFAMVSSSGNIALTPHTY